MFFPRSNLFVFKNSPFFNKPLLRITEFTNNLLSAIYQIHVTSGYVTNNQEGRKIIVTIILTQVAKNHFAFAAALLWH
jgi:hypothetical protein